MPLKFVTVNDNVFQLLARPPTGAPPLDPAGGLPSPRPPRLCSSKISLKIPCTHAQFTTCLSNTQNAPLLLRTSDVSAICRPTVAAEVYYVRVRVVTVHLVATYWTLPQWGKQSNEALYRTFSVERSEQSPRCAVRAVATSRLATE